MIAINTEITHHTVLTGSPHPPVTGDLHLIGRDHRLVELTGVEKTVLRTGHQHKHIHLQEIGHLGHVQLAHRYSVVLGERGAIKDGCSVCVIDERQRRTDMCARITTSSVHLAWTLSRDRNDINALNL